MSVGHFLRAHCVLRPEEGSVIHRGQKRCQFFGGKWAGMKSSAPWTVQGGDAEFSTLDSVRSAGPGLSVGLLEEAMTSFLQ